MAGERVAGAMAKRPFAFLAGALVFSLSFALLFTAYSFAELSPDESPVPQGLILAAALAGILVIPLVLGMLAPAAWMGALPPLAYLLAIVLAPVVFGGGWGEVASDSGVMGFLLGRVLGFSLFMGLFFLFGRGIRQRLFPRRPRG